MYLFLLLRGHNNMVSNWLHPMIDGSSTLNIFMTPTMMCVGLTTVLYTVTAIQNMVVYLLEEG
jgi:hypothetical protein